MLFKCVCKLFCFRTPVDCDVCRRLLIMLLANTWMLRFPKAQGLASDRNVIRTLINTSWSYDYCWMYQFDFDSQYCLLWSYNFSKFSHALRHAANKWILLWKQVTIGAWWLPDIRSALFWSLETVRAFFWQQPGPLAVFGQLLRWVYALSRTGGKVLEPLSKTMTPVAHYRDSNPRSLEYQKWVFYHYNIRIVVTLCYTRSVNEVQRVTYVKQNVGE